MFSKDAGGPSPSALIEEMVSGKLDEVAKKYARKGQEISVIDQLWATVDSIIELMDQQHQHYEEQRNLCDGRCGEKRP